MATGPGSQWCLDEPLHSVVAFSRGPVVLVDQGDKPTPALHPAAGNGNHVERLTRSGAASGVAVDEVSRIGGYPAEWIGELELERQKRHFAAAQLEPTPTVLARHLYGPVYGPGYRRAHLRRASACAVCRYMGQSVRLTAGSEGMGLERRAAIGRLKQLGRVASQSSTGPTSARPGSQQAAPHDPVRRGSARLPSPWLKVQSTSQPCGHIHQRVRPLHATREFGLDIA